MALNDYKILDSDITTKGVVNAPDRLTGTAQQNKAVFDRLIREVVKGTLIVSLMPLLMQVEQPR